MPITVSGTNTEFAPAPEGTHRAVCWRVIDLGLQDSTFGVKRVCLISWQLDEQQQDGSAFMVQRRYSMTLGKRSALREDLESWRGRAFTDQELEAFDLEALVGKSCLLGIKHAERDGIVYANIASVTALPKGTKPLPPIDDPYIVEGPSSPAFDRLTEKMQQIVAEGHERLALQRSTSGNGKAASPQATTTEEALNDEIPF